jgi:GT2 family glycosyltransferase
MAHARDVSIVIPSLNSRVIDDVIAALRPQLVTLTALTEVIVVGKDELGLVETDDTVRLVDTGHAVPPAVARNIGARHSSGNIICFLDSDCVPRQDWLQNLLAPFEDPAVSVVGGGVAFPADDYWRLVDNLATFYPYLHTASPGTHDLLPTLNLGFRRAVWDNVGPLDERYPFPAGEDADWTARVRLAGHRLHFEPRAVVVHRPARASFRDLWQHAVVFGRYSIKVDERYWELWGRPLVFRHWLLTLAAAPAMALWVTACVFSNRHIWKFLRAFPGVYLSKLGWCWGASKRLRGQVEWYQPGP